MLLYIFFASFYLGVFALCHSLLAIDAAKAWIGERMGGLRQLYRLGYNLLHLGMMALFLWLFLPGDQLLYQWQLSWAPLAMAIQIVGLSLVGWVLFVSFSFFEFAGLKQAWAAVAGPEQPAPTPRLHVGGPYRWCRHPLYFGTMLFFAFMPKMTVLGATFTAFVAGYGWFGSVYEERKLKALFGRDYALYSKRVKRLIPFLI